MADLSIQEARWRVLVTSMERIQHELQVCTAIPNVSREKLSDSFREALAHVESLIGSVDSTLKVVRALEHYDDL